MNEFASLARPLVTPPLHGNFSPASLADRAYLRAVEESGLGADLVIAIERGGGQVSVHHTRCFEEDTGRDEPNAAYAERIVKFLLWRSGGWRIVVSGPRPIGEHIKRAYAADGVRAFDAGLMSGVYERPFTVEVTEPGK